METTNEPRIDQQARGMRILAGDLAARYYSIQSNLMGAAMRDGFVPIVLPSVEPASIYKDVAGDEVANQMFVFQDKGGREMCLRPEATATCQLLGRGPWANMPNIGVCYWQRCYRYERPQAGRYREFMQFGVEVLNPTTDPTNRLVSLAERLLAPWGRERFSVNRGVKRGLGIYCDTGFEIVAEELGAQKQVCGGGPYDGGCGFAIGVDRLLLLPTNTTKEPTDGE